MRQQLRSIALAAERTLVDCLIAAVAMRYEAELLHADRDFDVIARHTPLRLVAL